MRSIKATLQDERRRRTARARRWVEAQTHLPAWFDAGRRSATRIQSHGTPSVTSPWIRGAGFALVGLVLVADALLRSTNALVLVAVVDEVAHLATSVLIGGLLLGLGFAPSRLFCLGLLLAGSLIDLDHVPQMLGATWSSPEPDMRPYSHSLVTAAILAAAAGLTHRRVSRHLLAGASLGVVGHLLRDIAGGPTAVLWPLTAERIGIHAWWYLLALVVAATVWAVRPGWPTDTPHPLRTPAAGVSRALVAAATLVWVVTLTRGMWMRYDTFRLAGFDTGIFVQGTWLLSQGHDPFVTVRGLGLFADHASFVLLLLAPLYALVPDPRVLLLVQVLGMALPALVLNSLFLRTGRWWPATVFPLVYLLYPAAQFAATFEFHPETIAPGMLVLGLHLALTRSRPWWIVPIAAALSCKEDVGLIVFGIGALLWTLGHRRRGSIVAATGVLSVLGTLTVVMPLVGGGRSIYFSKNYGIDTDTSSLAWVPELPRILEMAFSHATADDGLRYLMLILVPVAFLALAAPRWLLPAAGPVFVNLSSKVPELHEIHFHYLATASPFIVAAAFHGYLRVRDTMKPAHRGILLSVVLLAAMTSSAVYGPLVKLREEASSTNPAAVADVRAALDRMPADAAVSASWNLVPALGNRTHVYEFPVPFDKGWWGKGEPPASLRSGIQYVVLAPKTLRDMDRAAYERLRADPAWRPIVLDDDVLVLHRAP